MRYMTKRRSGLAAAQVALTPKNLANENNFSNKTGIGPLYYSSDMFFPIDSRVVPGFPAGAVNLSAPAPTYVRTAQRLSASRVSSFA